MKHLLQSAAASILLSACSGGGGSSTPAPAPPPPPVTNSPPTFSSAASVSVNENVLSAYQATASDADGDTLSFGISGGEDRLMFSIDGSTGEVFFLDRPDFEAPGDTDTNNVFEVTLSVSDGTDTIEQSVQVTVENLASTFTVRRVATGLTQPLFVSGAGDRSDRAFIVQKDGIIRILDTASGTLLSDPFLDISLDINTAGEGGLLGLEFDQEFESNRKFYVYVTNTIGEMELRSYTVPTATPNVADESTKDILLVIPQSRSNHQGGWIGLGPGGFMLIAAGDDDLPVNAANPAQDLNSLLGKMLQIDLNSDDFPGDPNRDYAIPDVNPIAAGAGLEEILAYGLRNPFRATFDPGSDAIIIADVGEGGFEEINVIPDIATARNFGWPRFEGTQILVSGATADNPIAPALVYSHGTGPFQGRSVTGGEVNRGLVEGLQGEYIFGDFVSSRIWSVPVDDLLAGTTLNEGEYTDQTSAFTPDTGQIGSISGFGTDDDGLVYILDFNDGEVFRVEIP